MTYYRYVVGALIPVFVGSVGGVLCSRCRWITNVSCTVLTAVLGWWHPHGHDGPSLFDAITANLRGGDRPPKENALLLGALSRALRERGEDLAATEAFNSGLALDADAGRDAADRPHAAVAALSGPDVKRTSSRGELVRSIALAFALFFLVSLVKVLVIDPSVAAVFATPIETRGITVETRGIALWLPSGWEWVDLDTLPASVERLPATPSTGIAAWAEEVNDGGATAAAIYLGADANARADLVPLLEVVATPDQDASAVERHAAVLIAALYEAEGFSAVDIDHSELGGRPTALLRADEGTPATRSFLLYVVFDPPSGTMFEILFTMAPPQVSVIEDDALRIVETLRSSSSK